MTAIPLTADFLPGLPAGFRHGMRFIWQPENDGNADDSAPGEAFLTRWGVTAATWADAVHAGVVTGSLADATQAMCGNVYLSRFWNAMRLGELPTAIGFMLFADATLTGPGHVGRLLQRIVGLTGGRIDGAIGNITLAATSAYLLANDQRTLVDTFIDADEAYLASLRNAEKFINGWTRREEEEQAIALGIVADEGDIITKVAAVGLAAVVITPLPPAAVPSIAPALLSGEGDFLVSVRRAA